MLECQIRGNIFENGYCPSPASRYRNNDDPSWVMNICEFHLEKLYSVDSFKRLTRDDVCMTENLKNDSGLI